jgi:hypothetical protein
MMLVLLTVITVPEPPAELIRAAELATSPAASERRLEYDVEGGIRLGFFWWSRKGVGAASWRFGETQSGCRFVELTAGSDPRSAPMKLNRWGTMMEVFDPRAGQTGSFGLMRITQSRSMTGVREEVSSDGAREFQRYDLLLALTRRSQFGSTAGALYHPSALGLGERATVATLALEKALSGELPIKQGGFTGERCLTEKGTVLFTLSDAVIDALDRPGRTSRFCYVHNGRLFDLVLGKTSSSAHPAHGRVIITDFTVIRRDTGDKNRLKLISGAEGDLRGFPVELTYQPNFWLRLRFTLRKHRATFGVK